MRNSRCILACCSCNESKTVFFPANEKKVSDQDLVLKIVSQTIYDFWVSKKLPSWSTTLCRVPLYYFSGQKKKNSKT